MSRRLDDLHPLLKPVCLEHMYEFRKLYIDIMCVLSFTYRSIVEQDALYAQGRDANGEIVDKSKVVTYARGGSSWHNIERGGKPAALAYDFVLYKSREVLPDRAPAWSELGRIGTELGLTWGVRRKDGSRWDLGHFQMNDCGLLSLGDARSGVDPRPLVTPNSMIGL